MTQIEAIYENGMFRPLDAIVLAENQRVTLSVQTLAADDASAWLDRVRQRQRQIVAARGFFPDSAPDIAEDRRQ